MMAGGSEKTSLENAKKYVEQNYRVDAFKQLVQLIILILSIMMKL